MNSEVEMTIYRDDELLDVTVTVELSPYRDDDTRVNAVDEHGNEIELTDTEVEQAIERAQHDGEPEYCNDRDL